MLYLGRGPFLALCAGLVISCGGGRDTATGGGPSARTSVSVARLTTVHDVLELPLLQSGAALYANVRISLADDGTFRVLSWRDLGASDDPVDATLQPPVPLSQLGGFGQPVQLTLRRLHLDDGVFHSVLVELNQGRWRYVGAPKAAPSLATADLRANSALYANEDHVVAMTSAPDRVEQFPLRLETRRYRICMDAQDEGADTVTLLSPSGAVLVAVRAGAECAVVDAQQGLYQVRHTYGGKGSTRTVFLRKLAVPQPPAQAQAGQPDEYWGILASVLDRRTHQVVFGPWFLGYEGPTAQGGCLGDVRGIVQATSATRMQTGDRNLFDEMNFFRPIRDSQSGALLSFAGPVPCTLPSNLGVVGLRSTANLVQPLVVSDGLAPLVFVQGPVTVGNFSPSSHTFGLRGAYPTGGGTPYDGTTVSLGKPSDDATYVNLGPLESGQVDAYLAEYRAVLRLRPGGFPGSSIPDYGQVALFNTADCSGPAMVVDQYDLAAMLPGPLGAFNGSVLLGVSTGADVYEQTLYRGATRHLIASGCIAPGSGFKPASIRVQPTTAEMVFSTKSCERCNLSGMDLSGRDLQNAKLAGSNLNNAHLNKANLAGADMRQAFLQGAQLPNANLDAANLCGAKLNAAPSTAGSSNVAANLAGAFLRNANLSKSNVSGVNFNDSNFYSANAGACSTSACDTYARPVCASAAGASLDGAQFSNAYLVGVDMSNVHGSGAVFSNAVLTGAHFNNAVLSPLEGKPANFSSAFIHGADFTSADLTNATFTNAYDAKAPGCMQFELGEQHTSFPGFAVPVTPDSTQCALAPAPAKTCVKFTFTHGTILPSSVVLATPTVPLADALPRNSASCTVAPLCGAPFPSDRVNTCW